MSSELGVERPTSLPLSESQVVERRVHFSDVERHHHLVAPAARHSTSTATITPRKSRPDPDFKPKRKRSMSFSSAGEHRFGNRWRYKRMPVLPYKFLLGGNITDPLNLGSLDKEEATASVAETSSVSGGSSGVSRRSAAVRVIIPPNINDPLNLDASSDNEELHTDALQRQLRRRRRRKRKRRLSEPVDGNAGHDDEMTIVVEEQAGGRCTSPTSRTHQITLKPLTINTDLFSPPATTDARRESSGSQPVTPTGVKPGTSTTTTTATTPTTPTTMQRPLPKKQRHKSDNKIVSPVIPQAGGDRKRHPSHSRHHTERPHLSQQNLKPPRNYNPKNELFQFGNYNKYYGYRNPDQTPDVRLQHLKREWFEGRDVLDIGCNIGHVSLTVARDFNPKRVVGIDIDKKLVNIAQKNIKHYLRKGDAEEVNFPKSMRLLYGPLRPPVQADGVRSFPHNIKFVHGNYVLESDELLETVKPEFDLVLCLSITKWIHLNWGDAGLKRFFRRIFYNLRPGGRLVLEPQAWPSYNKRRKLTKRIFENYKSICLFPDKFNDFLLHEVGFSTSEKLVTPNHSSRGFQRPIIIYTKAGGSNKASPVGEGTITTATTTTTTTATRTDAMDDEVFYPGVMGGSREHGRKDQKRGEKRRREGSEEEESSRIKPAQQQDKDVCTSPSHTRHNPETRVHSDKQALHPTTSEQQEEKTPQIRPQDKGMCASPSHTRHNPETRAHSDKQAVHPTTSEHEEEAHQIRQQDKVYTPPSHTQHNPETRVHSDKGTPHPTTSEQQEETHSIRQQDKDLCASPTHTQNPETRVHSDEGTCHCTTSEQQEETHSIRQQDTDMCASPTHTQNPETRVHSDEGTPHPTTSEHQEEVLKVCDSSFSVDKQDNFQSRTTQISVDPCTTTSSITITTTQPSNTVIYAKTTHSSSVPREPELIETPKCTDSTFKEMGTRKHEIQRTCVELEEGASMVSTTPPIESTITTDSECKIKAVETSTDRQDMENTRGIDLKQHTSVVSTIKQCGERDSLKRKAAVRDENEELMKRVRLENT